MAGKLDQRNVAMVPPLERVNIKMDEPRRMETVRTAGENQTRGHPERDQNEGRKEGRLE